MRTPATIAIALVAGVAITLVVATVRSGDARREAILAGIAGPDAALRIAAWDLVPGGDRQTNRDRPSRPPGESVGRTEILTHLRNAGESVDRPALAEAARQFVDRGWLPDPSLIEAAADLGDSGPLEAWLDHGWSADPGSLEPVRSALHAVYETADDDRAAVLTERLFGPSTPAHRGAIHAWLADRKSGPPMIESAHPLGRAVLALALRGHTTDVAEPSRLAAAAAVLNGSDEHSSGDAGPVPAWLLTTSGSAAHLDRLRERAKADDADAMRTLAMLDADRVVRAERRVLSNRTMSFDRRLLAASRLIERAADPGDAALLGLLAAGPADSDGTVHHAAVVAWTGLSPTARRRLEERWLDSEDPRDVRAGILLGTLRRSLSPGVTNPDVVETIQSRVHELARSPEAPPSLRRTARLASRPLGHPAYDPSELDLDAYARRSSRLADGRIDPDAVLLGLLAGDLDAERRLVAPPPPVSSDAAVLAREIGWRRSLAHLLRPGWIAEIGEPVPGDEGDLRLWVDLLAARRLAGDPVADEPGLGEDRHP